MKSWYLTGRLDNWTTGRPGARGTPDKSNDDDGDYVEDGDNDDNGDIDDDDDLIALKLSFTMTAKFWRVGFCQDFAIQEWADDDNADGHGLPGARRILRQWRHYKRGKGGE